MSKPDTAHVFYRGQHWAIAVEDFQATADVVEGEPENNHRTFSHTGQVTFTITGKKLGDHHE